MLLYVAALTCAVLGQESRSTPSCPERSQSIYQSRCSGWKKVDDSGNKQYSNSDQRVCSEMAVHMVIWVTDGHKFNQWQSFRICMIEGLHKLSCHDSETDAVLSNNGSWTTTDFSIFCFL